MPQTALAPTTSDPVAKRGKFPIQLVRVDVGEIAYSCAGFANPAINPISTFELETGISGYDSESKLFQVSVGFVAKNDPAKSGFSIPYALSVKVHAQYLVVEDRFPMDKIDQWAQLNGSAILLPFLREVVHSVTLKSGFTPFLMPLLEAPLYKVQRPESET
jgi:preprotein translocase subunit SecB